MLSSLFALVLLSGDGVPGTASRLAYAAHSVEHVTRGMHVTAAACFLLLAAHFFARFVVDLDALVARDLRREFA